MTPSYIQTRHGNIYVGPSRVTLESVITLWHAGQTPEQIQADFPSVPLAAVYGAIADYLAHREELDAFFAETESLDHARRDSEEAANAEFFTRRRQRLAAARERHALDDATMMDTSPPDDMSKSAHLTSPTS